jgi:hypothetical protein
MKSRKTLVAILFLVAVLGFSSRARAVPNGCGITNNTQISYGWSQNGYDQQLLPIHDTFCWLTEVEGNWQGTGLGGNQQGAQVQVERDGYWHIVTYQAGDFGFAYCLAASCFEGEHAGYAVDWDNQQFPSFFWNESALGGPASDCGNKYGTTCNGDCAYTSYQNGYPGIPGTESSLTMISGWPLSTGPTNGSGEYAKVAESSSGGINTIYAQSCANSYIWQTVSATFESIFVGTLYTTVPVFERSWGDTRGADTVDLLTNLETGICFITEVEGAFRGDFVAVNPYGPNGDWVGSSSSNVGGNFACMAYIVNH